MEQFAEKLGSCLNSVDWCYRLGLLQLEREQINANRLLFGRKVKKLFDGEFWDGEVKSYFKEDGFFRVKHSDGDVEDYFLDELKPLLVPDCRCR